MEPLLVFEREHNREEVPPGFNAATIRLDASLASPLKWDLEELDMGLKVLFDIDFGPLAKPLSHAGQFQALRLALDHFRDEVWPRFRDVCIGAILHKTTLTFPQCQEESLFFRRDAYVDYFELLASALPDPCEPYLLFDCEEVADPFLFSLLTLQDRFLRFNVGFRKSPLITSSLTWKEGKGLGGYIGRVLPSTMPTLPSIGILLPPYREALPDKLPHLEEIMNELKKKNLEFKTISEEFLTMEWEGLDTIITTRKTVPLPVQRALDGFAAASGTVISGMSLIDGKTE